jgi:3'-phosphoadenosine 5'-phosphosulfate sulfotransferase (PAPS reductase)/FAD synthetase
MDDPFKIDGPTCISFSGGRTSAYMLRKVLMAHGGALPAECHVVFANTGKEAEETLRFVRDCGEMWNVPITWVEYRPDGAGWEIVSFDTASRKGEPFEALIRKRNYLPNPVARFCTVELKILRIADFMRSLGHEEFEVLVGIRADEPVRVASVRANPSGGTRGIERRMPLADAGVTRRDVAAFWSRNDWDLGLPSIDGTTMHGNCDLCFLKHSAIVMSLSTASPTPASATAAPFGATARPTRRCWLSPKPRPMRSATRQQTLRMESNASDAQIEPRRPCYAHRRSRAWLRQQRSIRVFASCACSRRPPTSQATQRPKATSRGTSGRRCSTRPDCARRSAASAGCGATRSSSAPKPSSGKARRRAAERSSRWPRCASTAPRRR